MGAHIPTQRCPHGCYLPAGESVARDLNGREYCTVCHWDAHERRRTNVLSPMYREWPLLERRTGINENKPKGNTQLRDSIGVTTLTAPFGQEQFIHLRDAKTYAFCFEIYGEPEERKGKLIGKQQVPKYLMILTDKQQRLQRDKQLADQAKKREVEGEVPAEWRQIKPRTEHQPRKPRWVAFGPQELCLPWSAGTWVAPSFTVIPRIILDHSQQPVAKPRTNFCPDCFDVIERNGKMIAISKGMYVTQDHACMPEVYA